MATAANQANLTLEQTPTGYTGYYTESLAAAGNGNTLIIPSGLRHLAVTILASAGAKLQITLDPTDVINVSGETYIDWPEGEVTTETDMTLSPAVRGLRLVQTQSGTSSIKVGATT